SRPSSAGSISKTSRRHAASKSKNDCSATSRSPSSNQHGTAVVVLAALLNAMLAVIVIGIASLPAAFNVVMAWKSITPPAKQPLSDSAKSSLVGLAIIAAIIAGFILLATNVTP